MKKTYTIIAVILTWTIFLIWEGFVFHRSGHIEMYGLRLDLILIFPGLAGLTIYYFLKMKEESAE